MTVKDVQRDRPPPKSDAYCTNRMRYPTDIRNENKLRTLSEQVLISGLDIVAMCDLPGMAEELEAISSRTPRHQVELVAHRHSGKSDTVMMLSVFKVLDFTVFQ